MRFPGSRRSSSELSANTAVETSAVTPNANLEKGAQDESQVPFMTSRTFFMAVLVSFGGICFGYDTGQISGFLEMDDFRYQFADERENGVYSLSWRRSGLIVGMLSIGTLFGALIAGPIANNPKLGRKWSVVIWSIVFILGNVLQTASQFPAWGAMLAGRIVSGFGIGGMSVLVPTYQGESSPAHIRGMIVCSYQLFITIGILLANLVNFGTESMPNTGSWRIPLGIGFVFPLILAAGIFLFPETPRFDFRQGKIEKARTNIARFHGVGENHKVVNLQMIELQEKLEAEAQGGDHPWYEVFTGPRMLYRILLGMAVQAFQQLTGANFFFYYGTTIFSSVGLANPFVTTIILSSVNVVCTLPGLYMVERYGRRKCLITGALWQAMCFLVFASLGYFKLGNEVEGYNQSIGYVMIVFACLFIASFASTWGPMAWAVVSEMYPSRYRSESIAFCSASNWLFNFYLAFFTPLILDQISYAYGYVFAGCNLAAAAVVYFFLLESSGKSLEEIDTMYLLHVSPLKSSKWVAPVGEELVTADKLMLDKGGRNIKKKNEAGVGAGEHTENSEQGLFNGQTR